MFKFFIQWWYSIGMQWCHIHLYMPLHAWPSVNNQWQDDVFVHYNHRNSHQSFTCTCIHVYAHTPTIYMYSTCWPYFYFSIQATYEIIVADSSVMEAFQSVSVSEPTKGIISTLSNSNTSYTYSIYTHAFTCT